MSPPADKPGCEIVVGDGDGMRRADKTQSGKTIPREGGQRRTVATQSTSLYFLQPVRFKRVT